MEKRSNVTFRIEGTKVRATLFLTNEDLEKSCLDGSRKMGTSYGLSWYQFPGNLPPTMQTSEPERNPDGVSWVYMGKIENVPWYEILECETSVYPVSISRNKTVDVDYRKWMYEDTRQKKLYRYSCVEHVVCDGFVWASSAKQARLLVRDFVTGVCEYQDKEMDVTEWESEGVDVSVSPTSEEPEPFDTVVGCP